MEISIQKNKVRWTHYYMSTLLGMLINYTTAECLVSD